MRSSFFSAFFRPAAPSMARREVHRQKALPYLFSVPRAHAPTRSAALRKRRLYRKAAISFSERLPIIKAFSERLPIIKAFSERLYRKDFVKARTLLFDLFSCEMFALTSGGSAYRRRQHQYLHPARVYAPAKQENPASEKAAARGYPCGGRSCRSVSFSRGSARRRRPGTYRRSARAGPSGRARAASGWRCPFPHPCRIQSRP